MGPQTILNSKMRVLIDDMPISATYGDEGDRELKNHAIDITPYCGKEFQLCFQTKSFIGRNLLPPSQWGDEYLGDFVMLDNIFITPGSVSTTSSESDDYR